MPSDIVAFTIALKCQLLPEAMASEWVAYIFAKMTDRTTIELASRCDIDRWMELAEKTKESFPGFDSDEHRETVLRFIDSREAVCAKRGDEIAGILLFSGKDSELCYLSVDPEARRMHIAERMLSFMLGMMDPCKDIRVITYRDAPLREHPSSIRNTLLDGLLAIPRN